MHLPVLALLVVDVVAHPAQPIPPNDDLLLPFAIIADLDREAKDGNVWYSPMSIGSLALNANRSAAFIHWTSTHNYTSKLNFNGRGMELSDMKYYDGKLLTIDDKTGVVYKMDGKKAVPWVILSRGDGNEEGFFKGEWFTIKDGYLYCGSHGREYTTPEGEYLNDTPMYVKRISSEGAVQTENWLQRYVMLRAAIGIHFPGYVIHEAVQWSDIHNIERIDLMLAQHPGTSSKQILIYMPSYDIQKFVNYPQQQAHNSLRNNAKQLGTAYLESAFKADSKYMCLILDGESKFSYWMSSGLRTTIVNVADMMAQFTSRANVLIIASDDMEEIVAVPIGKEMVTRGFSAFQFVPRTDDTVIVATKTEEISGTTFSSFVMVFTIAGEVILDETRIPGSYKYEGLEFLYDEILKNLTA